MIYSESGFTDFRCSFRIMMCLKADIVEGFFPKWKYRIFCHDVTTQCAAAPPVVDPLFLTCHSVINNNDIL